MSAANALKLQENKLKTEVEFEKHGLFMKETVSKLKAGLSELAKDTAE